MDETLFEKEQTYRARKRYEAIQKMSQKQLLNYAIKCGDDGEKRDIAFDIFYSRASQFFDNISKTEKAEVELRDLDYGRYWVEQLTSEDMSKLLQECMNVHEKCTVAEYEMVNKLL